MAAGEHERIELLNGLVEALGEDVARKLMDSLPPFSWDQIVTKDDLNALSAAITAKFDQVDAQFTAVSAEFVGLRGEIAKEIAGVLGKIGETDSKIERLGGDLSKEVAGLSVKIGETDSKIEKLDSNFSKKIAEQTRVMVLTISGFSLAVCGAMAGGILFA